MPKVTRPQLGPHSPIHRGRKDNVVNNPLPQSRSLQPFQPHLPFPRLLSLRFFLHNLLRMHRKYRYPLFRHGSPDPASLVNWTWRLFFSQKRCRFVDLQSLQISRLQAHRAHLTAEYTTISKLTRRAMHELDMAAMDLRAAETRRRIADSHMEKARAGVLGIDALVVDPPVV